MTSAYGHVFNKILRLRQALKCLYSIVFTWIHCATGESSWLELEDSKGQGGHPPFKAADEAQVVFRATVWALVVNTASLRNLGSCVAFFPISNQLIQQDICGLIIVVWMLASPYMPHALQLVIPQEYVFFKKSNHLVLSLGLSIVLCEFFQTTLLATPTSPSCLPFVLFISTLSQGRKEKFLFLIRLAVCKGKISSPWYLWNSTDP